MADNIRVPQRRVIGPDGGLLTHANLPPSSPGRWIARYKAEIVAAVNGGLLTLEEACDRYALSVEEFLTWRRAEMKFGMKGLRATRLRQYRDRKTD